MTAIQSQIIEAVCKDYGQRVEDILGKSRFSEYVKPRHIAMYLLFKEERLSKKQIGRIWKTNHTTVIAAIKNVESDKSLLRAAQVFTHRIKDDEIRRLFYMGFCLFDVDRKTKK